MRKFFIICLILLPVIALAWWGSFGGLKVGDGVWTPIELGGELLAWYDATDTDTITEAAGNVSQWDDKSTNGYDIVQSTGANQPDYVSNSVVKFNGTTDFLWRTGDFMYDNLEVDIYFVGSVISNTPGDPFSETKSDNVKPFYRFVPCGNAGQNDRMAVFIRSDSDSTRIGRTTALSTGGAYNDAVKLFQYRDTGTSIWGRYNADSSTSVTGAYTRSFTTLDRFNIGALYRVTPAAWSDCDMYEVVITDNLSTGNQAKVEGYLSHKYGLEGLLPASHQYKSTAP